MATKHHATNARAAAPPRGPRTSAGDPTARAVLQPTTIANAPLPAADAPVEERHTGSRFRWGVGGGIGWQAPYSAFGLSSEVRIGSQLTNFLGAYLAIGGHLGVGVGYNVAGLGASVNGTLIGHFTMAALLEVIVANRFWLAAGPAFGLGGMALGGLGIATTGGTITGCWCHRVLPHDGHHRHARLRGLHFDITLEPLLLARRADHPSRRRNFVHMRAGRAT